MSRADDRRKAQARRETEDRSRPVETPTEIKNRECPTSRTGQHDFSMKVPSPIGSDFTLYSCWYCSTLSPNSKHKLEVWNEFQALPKWKAQK